MTEKFTPALQTLTSLDAQTSAAIAGLHVKGLADSINSLRGERVVASLYRQLVESGHLVIVASFADSIVGVIAVTDSRKALSMLRLLARSPGRWLTLAFSRPVRMWRLVRDAVAVERARADSKDHLYIASLVVDTQHQRLGIARTLVMSVLEIAGQNSRVIFVDTRIDNVGARNLYQSVGFTEHDRTKLSVVFKG